VIAGIVLYRPDPKELKRCLESLRQQNLGEFELKIALIDNNRGENEQKTKDLLAEVGLLPHLILWESSDNIGFGAGHNHLFRKLEEQGVEFTHYLCVNPDSILHFDCVREMMIFAREHQDKGIFEARQFPLEHPKPYDPKTGKTKWCSGCTLLVPREIYLKTGGYDESFFLYCEDVDLSWQVRTLGHDCFLVPPALVSHYVFGKNRDNENERKQMLLSGYRLAHKYRHIGFMRAMLGEMKRLVPAEQIEGEITRLPNPVSPLVAKEFERDFDHGFHFAPARW
jgi:hypothetical protein